MADPIPILLKRKAKLAKEDPMTLLQRTVDIEPTYEEAAAALGITRPTLDRWRRRLGVDRRT